MMNRQTNKGLRRSMDSLGRIVLPMDVRRMLRIQDGDEFEIFFQEDEGRRRIILTVVDVVCDMCGKGEDNETALEKVGEKHLCQECIKKLYEIVEKKD